MNEVILLGRIANKLPKVEELDDKPLFLSLAVDKIVAGRKTTRFIPINVWGKEAENLCSYKKQGDEIFVKGELDISTYTKEGKEISRLVLNSKKIIYTSGSSGRASNEDEGKLLEEIETSKNEEINNSNNYIRNEEVLEVNKSMVQEEKKENTSDDFPLFDFGPLV